MLTDIEIAQSVTPKYILDIAKNAGIDEKYNVLFRDIEDTFQGFFGTKVKLDAGRRKGKIVIEYNSNDDLERIISMHQLESPSLHLF